MTLHLILYEHELVLMRHEEAEGTELARLAFALQQPQDALVALASILTVPGVLARHDSDLRVTAVTPVVQVRRAAAGAGEVEAMRQTPNKYFLETSDSLVVAQLPEEGSEECRVAAADQSLLTELETFARNTGLHYVGLAVHDGPSDAAAISLVQPVIGFPRSDVTRTRFADIPPLRRTVLAMVLVAAVALPIVGVPLWLSADIRRLERLISADAIPVHTRARNAERLRIQAERLEALDAFRSRRHSALLDLAVIEGALPSDAAIAVFHSDSTAVTITMIAARTAEAVEQLTAAGRFRSVRLLGAVAQDAGVQASSSAGNVGVAAVTSAERVTLSLVRATADGGR